MIMRSIMYTFTRRQMQEVQQENNSEKHPANLKYKYRQEEKTTRNKCNISVLIPRPLLNVKRKTMH